MRRRMIPVAVVMLAGSTALAPRDGLRRRPVRPSVRRSAETAAAYRRRRRPVTSPIPSASISNLPCSRAPAASNGGSGPAFCVRSCDGRYFPLTRGNATPVQMCQAFCPASPTRVFYGSTIENAASSSGERYADSENAFAYRKALRADCTCNGRDPAGLAPVDLTLDTSLRPGDVIATTDGLVAYSGVKVGVNQTANSRRCFLSGLDPRGARAARRNEGGAGERGNARRARRRRPRRDGLPASLAPKRLGNRQARRSRIACPYRPTMTPMTFGADRYFSSIRARAAARFSGVNNPRFSARIIQQ